MLKKILFVVTLLILFPFSVSAKCDLSVKNMRALSQKNLDLVYAHNSMALKKPKLIVSRERVRGYYAEEYRGVITIYPKSFEGFYCDKYFDGLSPFVAQVINHEYTHYLDEKLHISRKIGEKKMSEKTANIGEKVFGKLISQNTYDKEKKYSPKFLKFMQVIEN